MIIRSSVTAVFAAASVVVVVLLLGRSSTSGTTTAFSFHQRSSNPSSSAAPPSRYRTRSTSDGAGSFATTAAARRRRRNSNFGRPGSVLVAAAASRSGSSNGGSNNNKNGKSRNEFSRTIKPERVLQSSSKKQRRAYEIDVEADEGERTALAKRFDLSAIDRLRASLTLRQERGSGGGASSVSKIGVEVEGAVVATVTQTCVRTNEDFNVDLEFPLYCVVRPVAPVLSSSLLNALDADDEEEEEASSEEYRPAKGKKQSRRRQRIDDMDVVELQRLLQNDILANDDDDVLMEDESIYDTYDGILDVGELVSQLFWLQLDPYPKKPGTTPIQRSITG